MKKLFTLSFILFSFFAQGDYWTQKADFGGAARAVAVGFSIGDKGFIGTGWGATTYHDFWEYDPLTNVWTQKADFGGMDRRNAIGFSINNKGYVGYGMNGSLTLINDFWEYDLAMNTWSQKTNFGGVGRINAVGFSIGNKGYIGTGNGIGYYKDFWEYDPVTDAWTQKADFGGLERAIATGFSDGAKGYIGTGINFSTSIIYFNDFWEWDPNTNVWTQKAIFGGSTRAEACSFPICPYGYLGLGTTQQSSGTVSDFWKYDFANNTWSQAANFGPGLRELPVTFSIGSKGYVGTGLVNDLQGSFKNDFWEYTPDSVCTTGTEELPASNFQFTISPNPAKEFIVISYPLAGKENIDIAITNAEGKKVYETKHLRKESFGLTSDLRLPTSNFQKGIYFLELSNGKQKAVKKFVKE